MSHPCLLGISLAALTVPIHADTCLPTPHRTTGTHYEPVTVQKTDVSKGVVVRGRVVAAPDCRPVADARVAHWQAGENGRYSDRLRAYLFTDAAGRFQFETEWPNLNPPHIHFIVSAAGYKTLETQWIGDDRQDQIDFTMVVERE
jgi:protocatechuate 3,4-dioxygenase beta subunit